MAEQKVKKTRAGVTALQALAQARVLDRLQQARVMLKRNYARHAARASELLQDALDRLEAAQVVARVIGPAATDADAPGSQSSRQESTPTACWFRAEFGKPVSEFLLIPFGEVGVERALAGGSFTFDRAHADAAVQWFDALARKLAIDYEHQSFDLGATRSDGLRPAAGWIGGLEAREDGLWATKVEWTSRASALLRDGEYRYFSPVIFWGDEEYSELVGLGPVALTNDPAMHGVQALAAGRMREAAGEDMPTQSRRHGTHASDDDKPIPARRDRHGNQSDSREAYAGVAGELAGAQAEIIVLRQKLASQEADAFVERGLRLGKILDSTSMDWRGDFARDPQHAEERLGRAPVLRPPGRLVTREERGGGQRYALSRTATLPEHLRRVGLEAADLEAYERAVAAGRVLMRAGAS